MNDVTTDGRTTVRVLSDPVAGGAPDLTPAEVGVLAEKVHAAWWAVHEAMDRQATAHDVRGETSGALWHRLYKASHGLSATAELLELSAKVLEGSASPGTKGYPKKAEAPR